MYIFRFILLSIISTSFILGACCRYIINLFYPNLFDTYKYFFIVILFILGYNLGVKIHDYLYELTYREWLSIQSRILRTDSSYNFPIYTLQELNTIYLNSIKKRCINNLDKCCM